MLVTAGDKSIPSGTYNFIFRRERMKKNLKTWLCLIMAAAMMFALAACSSGTPSDPGTSQQPQESAAQPEGGEQAPAATTADPRTPVSYTHLDVYKRQLIRQGKIRCFGSHIQHD